MKRILCWDEKLVQSNRNVNVIQHKPEKKNIALYCDDLWECEHNCYAGIVKVGNVYRLYYRANECICVAESTDGITFTKPIVGIHEYNQSKCNNIVYIGDETVDNFAVFLDTNPNCPVDQKFKALSSHSRQLGCFVSADGYDFRFLKYIPVKGNFDSYNVCWWDEKDQKYYMYYRAYHHPDGSDLKDGEKNSPTQDIRDVRFATSTDFDEWQVHGRIKFDQGQKESELYTNQIQRYYREPNTFIGFPTRYVDRKNEKRNFYFMPTGDKHLSFTGDNEREGTALTDCLIMTSNDAITFNRRDTAFLTPGIENNCNWWYGDCYTAYGLIETPSLDGAPNQISFYAGENYRVKNVHFRRFTVRLDGFFSWYANDKGGEIITKPVTIDGEKMFVNFETSIAGGLKITLLDQDDKQIDGYQTYVMFGNTVNRPIEFEKPLISLKGKTVKLKIELTDCHLYSLTIE